MGKHEPQGSDVVLRCSSCSRARQTCAVQVHMGAQWIVAGHALLAVHLQAADGDLPAAKRWT